MAKSKTIESNSTPGHFMQLRSWLAELVILRANNGKLPPNFWKLQKYKWIFANEIKAVTKFIKNYGAATVVKVVYENKDIKTYSSYGEIEFLLQKEHERLCKLKSPKDTSPHILKNTCVKEDLRDFEIKKTKSTFEKLEEIENG